MPRGASIYRKSVRRWISLPGILEPILDLRSQEFRYPALSPYLLELICFDLRKRRAHDLTLPFGRLSRKEQIAFDRLLARYYKPGRDQQGLLPKLILGEEIGPGARIGGTDFAQFRTRLTYSETLAPCIEVRWKEAGYASFSAYVTAVIRYDLLLLGPHKYFSGDDKHPEILESLDRGTAVAFAAAIPQSTYVDYLLDKAAGRRLTTEERAEAIARLVSQLGDLARGGGKLAS